MWLVRPCSGFEQLGGVVDEVWGAFGQVGEWNRPTLGCLCVRVLLDRSWARIGRGVWLRSDKIWLARSIPLAWGSTMRPNLAPFGTLSANFGHSAKFGSVRPNFGCGRSATRARTQRADARREAMLTQGVLFMNAACTLLPPEDIVVALAGGLPSLSRGPSPPVVESRSMRQGAFQFCSSRITSNIHECSSTLNYIPISRGP